MTYVEDKYMTLKYKEGQMFITKDGIPLAIDEVLANGYVIRPIRQHNLIIYPPFFANDYLLEAEYDNFRPFPQCVKQERGNYD